MQKKLFFIILIDLQNEDDIKNENNIKNEEDPTTKTT